MTEFIWPSDQDRADNDELNRVCDYLEDVLEDESEWVNNGEHYKRELDAALEREQALTAHVELLDDIAERALFLSEPEDFQELVEARKNSPATSLDRLIAEKQIEALEDLRKQANNLVDVPRWMLIDKIRQLQAQGEEPCD